MKRQRAAILAAVVIALAACSTAPTVYGPAMTPDAMGWRQQQIETDRFRVSFMANPDLRPPQVEDLAMRRAAEIARDNGASWFRVAARDTELVGGRRGGGTSVGVGGTTGSFGSGVGVGIGFDLSPDTRHYQASMEILLGRGAKPTNAPDVYDVQPILMRTGG
jgi:hypothetical protein